MLRGSASPLSWNWSHLQILCFVELWKHFFSKMKYNGKIFFTALVFEKKHICVYYSYYIKIPEIEKYHRLLSPCFFKPTNRQRITIKPRFLSYRSKLAQGTSRKSPGEQKLEHWMQIWKCFVASICEMTPWSEANTGWGNEKYSYFSHCFS